MPLILKPARGPSVVFTLVLIFVAATAKADGPSRAIGRTHRTIMSTAFAVESAGASKRLEDLRKAIVLNTAARIAFKKEQLRPAMALALAGRALARDVFLAYGGVSNVGFEADPDEKERADGGEGKDADAAVAEAEKRVPPELEIKKLIAAELEIDKGP